MINMKQRLLECINIKYVLDSLICFNSNIFIPWNGSLLFINQEKDPESNKMVVVGSIKYVLIRFQHLYQTPPTRLILYVLRTYIRCHLKQSFVMSTKANGNRILTYLYPLPSTKTSSCQQKQTATEFWAEKSVQMRLHIREGLRPIVPGHNSL